MINFIIGLLSSFIIAFVAYKRSSLSKSGLIAAILLGTGIYYFGGFWFSAIMVAFFLSSTLLTKFKSFSKKGVHGISEKGGNRDYIQVIANGGVGLVFAIIYFYSKNPIFFLAYAVSFSEANADTWASEIGVLSKTPPISIINFKPLKKGVSGGVSILGTSFAFLGSGFISFIFFAGYVLMFKDFKRAFVYAFISLIVGFIGSLIDSYLGASFQAQYYCEDLQIITEKKKFNSINNTLIKGFSFINNDAVNILSNIFSSIIALCIIKVL